MSFLLRRLAGLAVRHIANDPRARQKAADAARVIADEARQIARDDDPARAAGRAVRRALGKLDSNRPPNRDDNGNNK